LSFLFANSGLGSHYWDNIQCHSVVRKLLALPLLPSEHMLPAFQHVQTGHTMASNTDKTSALRDLMRYVDTTWLQSNVWSVDTVSVYRERVRTNNDMEGWHRRLNQQARRSSLPFYLLVRLLHDETGVASLQARLLSEGRLRRHSRKKFALIDCQLWTLWDEYQAGTISTSSLLHAASRLQVHNLI